MKSSWWFRFIFLKFLVIISFMMILPTVFHFDKESSYPVKSKINLGLDLQGGLYMILGIDFKRVYRDEVTNYLRRAERVLNDEEIKTQLGELVVTDELDPTREIIIEDTNQLEKSKEVIKKYFGTLIRLTHEEGNKLTYGLSTALKKDTEEQAVSKSIEVIRNRIDEFGVTEPEITSQGMDRIVVQLPGVKDIDRAKELIGKTAKLEFRMVNDEVSPVTLNEWLQKAQAAGITFEKGMRFSNYLTKLNDFLRNDLPKGYELAFQRDERRAKTNQNSDANNNEDKTDQNSAGFPILVESESQLTGEDLQDAHVQIDSQKNQPYVGLAFNSAGAKKFEQITGDNVGRRLAVILDGNVYTAPVIQQKIGGGNAQVTLGYGNFNETLKQAKDLALVLRAGALPVQLDFEEQRVVGPSLGSDSIEKAEIASLIGAAIIFLFLIFYYKLSGLIAVITLVLNVMFTLAMLVAFEATLTLPGIAGIALTIGMAVDGNIIIFERIREEIAKGSSGFKAVEEGFQHAFWAILDANVTTSLAGICLLNFGTGPIRGFAVTLLIGIVATVYSSYYVAKIMFDLYSQTIGGRKISI